MKIQNQKGLTLIEIIIVVVILGILASILIPQFGNNQNPQKPKEIAAKPNLTQETLKVWPPIHEGNSLTLDNNILRKNYYVVLDASGSMNDKGCSGNQNKFDSAVAALNNFFGTIPPEDNVGLLIFDGKGLSERVPLGVGNRAQLSSALSDSGPSGGTPLSSAVQLGYGALTNQASLQLGYGEYHLVIVTDGEASSGYDPTKEVNIVIEKTSIIIHTIGYCIGSGHSLNQPGRTLYTSVDNAQSLSHELQAVLAESKTFDITEFK